MRTALVGLILVTALTGAVAHAQTVYVPLRGRVIAVPVAPDMAEPPTVATTPSEGGMVRIDGLPTGAVLAVDGRALGAATEVSGGWISLAPGPHFIDVALPGGTSLRLTVVTPVESSGYQVVPKP